MPIIKSVIIVIYCIGFSNLYIELTLNTSKRGCVKENHIFLTNRSVCVILNIVLR